MSIHRFIVELKSVLGVAALSLLLGMSSTAQANPVALDEDFGGIQQHDLSAPAHCNGCSGFSISGTSGANSVNGVINGNFLDLTAIADANGTKTFNIDSAVPATSFTIDVDITPLPDLVNDNYNIDEDASLTNLTVVTNDDTGSGGGTITAVGLGSQGGTIAIAADNQSVDYTPAADNDVNEVFTYTYTDSNGNPDTATVTITINALPDLVDDGYNIDEDASLTNLTVVADNDDVGTAGGSITGVSAGSQGGTIAIAAGNQSIDYTPAADVDVNETFTYTYTDGDGDADTATVTITMNALPDLVDDGYNIDEDASLTNLTVVADNDDTGTAGGSITGVSAGSQGGTIAIAAGNQSIDYTPAADVDVNETFTYTYTDGDGDADTATVTITINALPDLVDDGYNIDEDASLTNLTVVADNDDVGTAGGSITAVSVGSQGGTIAIAAGNQSIDYTPAADVDVNETFTYTYTDGDGDADTATVTITMNALPDLVDDGYNIDEDASLTNLTVVADNDDTGTAGGSITGVSAGSQGGTIAIAAGNQSIDYTPAADVDVNETFTYTYTDGDGDADTATVTITINALPDLVDDGYNIDEDASLTNLTVVADNDDTGTAGGSITGVSAGSQGGTIAINADNQTIDYTPAADVDVNETFTYTYTDGDGDADTATVTITINALPDLVDDGYNIDEDASLTNLTVVADNDDTGTAGGSITAVGVGSQGGTIAINADNQTIDYTPAADVDVNETFTYTYTDGDGDADTATVTITINALPDLVDDGYNIDEDASLTNLTVVADNDDVGTAGGSITGVSAGSQGGTIAIAAGNQTIDYTPAADVDVNETFTYTYTDGDGDADTATVTITINALPDLVDDGYNIDEDASLTNLTVVADNDDVGTAGGSITGVSAGSQGGTIAIAAGNQSVDYTPAADVDVNETFTYTYTDGDGDADTATVTITINALPDLVDDGYNIDEDASLTNLTVVADNDDTGTAGGSITGVSAGSQGGTIAINADNQTIDYTPAADVDVNETFTYTYTDGDGDADTATVTITINALPDLVDDGYNIDEDASLTNLTVVADNDDTGTAGGSITAVGVGSQGGTIAINADNQTIDYTPAADVDVNETFTYTYTDGDGDADTATVTITINALPDLVDDGYNIDEDASLTNLTVVADNDDVGTAGGSITGVSAGSQGGTIAIAAGNQSIDYTPAADVDVNETFTYTYTDGDGDADTATVTITINALPDLVDDGYNIDEDASLTNLTVVADNDDIGTAGGSITAVGVGSQGGTIAINADNQTIDYTPAADVDVNETFTYTYTDGDGDADTATVTITINALPDLVDDGYNIDEDASLTNLTVVADNDDTGTAGGTITAVGVGSQGGTIAINADNQTIDYTPAADVDVNETFTYTYTDGDGDADTATVTITINALPDLVDDGYNIDEDASLTNLTVVADNDDVGTAGGSITGVSAGSQGGTIAIAAGNQSVDYTPAADVDVNETFTYTYTDGNGDADTATVTITINALPDLVDDGYNIDEDASLTNLTVVADNDDIGTAGGSITAVGVGSQGGTIAINADNQTIDYTPAADVDVNETFTYTYTDGDGDADTATVTITINALPDLVDDGYNSDEDASLVNLLVLANDDVGTAGGSITAVSVGSQGGTIAIAAGNQSVDYTPAADVDVNETFTYTYTDGNGDADTATVTITINALPDLVDDGYNIDEDASLTNLTVVADNDDIGTAGGSITAVGVGSQGGTIAINADNQTIDYTPAADVDVNETFTYTYTDGDGDADTATVTITINALPDLVDDGYNIDEDASLTNLTVVADNDDTGTAGGSITAVSVGSQGGTIAIAAGNQSIDYTPAADVDVNETFTYTYTDGNGDADTATVTITINALPDLVDDGYNIDEDASLTNLTVVADNDDIGTAGGSITAVGVGSQGGTIAINADNQTIDYTPAADVDVNETFTYTYTDGDGDADTATVTITINALPDLVDDGYNIDEDASLTNLTVVADNDDTGTAGGSITAVSVGTQGGTIAIAAGNQSIDYTPAADVDVDETFTYTYTDGNGDADTATVTITMNALPDLVDDGYNVDEDASLTNLTVVADNDDIGTAGGSITGVSAGSQGGTIAINADNQTIDYTPAADVDVNETFTYTYTDGDGDADTATVTITINALPDLVDDGYNIDEDASLTNLTVVADNDDTGTAGGSITAVGVGSQGGTIAINADNQTIDYTPAADVDVNETFTYTYTDGDGDADTATVTITINALPDLVDDGYASDEDASLVNLLVLANDDVGTAGGSITAVSVGGQGGTIAIAAGSQSVDYTPAADVDVNETFTYTYTDGNGDADTATVTITINALPDLVDDGYNIDEDASLTNLTVVADNDDIGTAGGSITAVGVGSQGGTIAINADNQTIDYTPAADVDVNETFTYTYTDGDGDADTATVTITINALPDLVDDGYNIDEDASLTNLTVVADNDDTGTAGGSITAVSVGSQGGTIAIAAGNQSIDYTPAADVDVDETFTYTYTDGNGDADTATVTITMNALPDLVDDGYGVVEDDPLTNLLVLANDDVGTAGGSITAVSVGSQGGTIAIAAGNQSIDYTPAADVDVDETFTYTYTDGNGDADTATVTITIDAIPELVDDGYNSDEDASLVNLLVLANDDTGTAGGSITGVSVGSQGGTIAIAAGNQSIDYTPAADVDVDETFTYTYTDGNGDADTATVTITMNALPDLVDDGYNSDEDASLVNLLVLANDDVGTAGGSITAVGVGSQGGTIAIAAGNQSIDYTPAADVDVDETFTYTYTDGNGDADTATVTITMNALPDLVDDGYNSDEDASLVNLLVLANDDVGTAGGSITGVSAGSQGGTIAIAAGNQSIDYTPAADVDVDETFTYTYTDGNGDADTATVTITMNALPDLVDDGYNSDEDASLVNLLVLANDDVGTAGGSITAVSVGSQGGTIAIAAGNQSVDYTPAADVDVDETFTYTYTDGNGDADTATVTITMNALPDLVDDGYNVDEDASLTNLTVVADNDDVGTAGGSITAVSVGSQGGTIAIAAGNQSIDYTPAADVDVNETFTYTYTDGDGDADTATVTITINALPDLVDDGYNSDEDASLVNLLVLANDDVGTAGGSITSVSAGSQGGTIAIAAGSQSIDYKPAADVDVDETFTYTYTDGNGDADTATVTITMNALPDLVDDGYNSDEDASLVNLLVLANDDVGTAGGSITAVSVGSQGGTIAIAAGNQSIDYTPAADVDVDETFTYTYTDGNGDLDTATVTITMNALPDLVDDGYNVDEDASLTNLTVVADNDDVGTAGGSITAVSVGSQGGTIAIAAGSQSIDYTPAADVDVDETFTYTYTDGNGDTDTATVTITMNALPDLVDDGYPINEDAPLTNLTVVADNDDTGTAGGSITAVSVGSLGATIAINADNQTVDYTPATNINGVETFTYTYTDGDGDSDTATVTMTISEVNDDPEISSNGGATLDINFDENTTGTITTVIADDLDAGDGTSGVALTYTKAAGLDATVFLVDLNSGAVSFNTAQDFEAQSDVTGGDNIYEVTVQALDDEGAMDTQLIRVALQNVNEAPTATNLSNTIGYNEDAGTVDIPNIVVSDIDDALSGGTYTVNLTLNDTDAGALTTSGTASYNTGSGLWTITDTLTNVNAALAAVDFVTGADHDTSTTITTHVEDQDGDGPTDGTINLNVTPVNDAPDATNLTVTTGWFEDQATVDLDNIVVTDVDDADVPQTITATLTLADTSAGVLSEPGSSTYTPGTGVWTITNDLATVNSALASVVFVPAADYDVSTSITTQIDDAAAGPGGLITLTVTPVNDAPTATFTTQTITYNEDTNGVDALVPNIVISDVDDADYPQTITVIFTLADYLPVTFNDPGFNAVTGVWTMTDTLANVNTTLAGLTFDATTDWDEDSSFQVTIRDQGTLGPANTTVTLDVVPTNDRPIVLDQAFAVDENAPNGTVVGTVAAYNEESVGCTPPTLGCETLTFSITGTAFAIDDDGIITVAGTSELDRETVADFTPTVTVLDDGTPPKDDDAIITISLNPLNDNTPVGVDDAVSVDELDTVNFDVLTEGIDLDADLPPETLTVSEVDGDPAKVGVAQDLVTGGDIVGSLTINADGSATFVATADNTVEQFEATQTYTVSDGDNDDPGITVTITINPQNDNQPGLTSDGTDFATAGVEYDEGARTASNKLIIPLDGFFIDLDIDEDGIQDSSTGADNDTLVYTVTNNTNAILITTEISGGDLAIYSPTQEHGTADITVTATDTADPAGNISSVDLDFTVTVNSVNDAPTYIPGSYSTTGYTVLEDAPDIPLPLETAFSDQDTIGDSDNTDDSMTYTITVIDVPAVDAIETVYVDLPFTVISDDENTPSAGSRTTVYETTSGPLVFQLAPDGHGYLDVTVRATDQGRPPEAPADPIYLFDEESFRITVQGVGDDTPGAVDDHFDDFPELVMEEDGEAIIFDVLSNDYLGDVPSFVISTGQTITDTSGADHTWRTTSRLTDRNNVGDFVIEVNGEVSCANAGCQDDETVDTTIEAAGILDNSIMYKPALDFNGEDTFTYCIQDTFPGSEPAFTPPADVRCATVTVNVTPVNDLPRVPSNIIYEMDQAEDLIVTLDDGLATKVTGVDNTHVDGLGCNPNDPLCVPPVGRDPDTLYFSIDGFATAEGVLTSFDSDGTFTYRPSATFSGSDSFEFNVCETPVPTVDTCVFDILVTIVVDAIEGAPEGLSDDVVEVDFDLADIPLELPVGPEANVLIVNDDSGSMAWDILTDQNSGLYYFDTGNYIYYTMKATAGGSSYVAPGEEDAPNQGLWRLRNSDYNKVYYNPDIRYEPWNGLNPDDVDFPNSTPTAALHNPLAPAGASTNLRVPQDYTGRAVVTTPEVCTLQCRWYRRGVCRSYRTVCTGGTNFQTVATNDLYLPRYYIWDNKDATETTPDLDAVPSPILDPDNSDGILVEIRPASEGGSDTYPRPEGRTDCIAAADTCSYDEELQNFANWFTYSRNREFTAKSALGKVVAASENIRVGYAKLNRRSDGQPIESMNTSERTGTKADLLDAIYLTQSSGGTPLRRSLRDAGRHFACKDNDIFNSNSDSVPGDAGCPVFAAPAGNCQQNFALLISDGAWNGGNPYVGDEDDDNDTNFDGGMYASSYDNSLADVAMEYYEFDLHNTLTNEVPTSSRDTDGAADDAFEDMSNVLMHQHMKTFTVGFGVNGLIDDEDVPTDYTQSFNWGSPTNTERKIDDMRHAAVNGRGQYLSAGNAATLADALVSAFEEFQQGSGAASAVSFNSQEILEDTLVFRSFYNTKNNTGDLIAQSIDLDGTVTEEPVWNAAARLDEIDPDDRVILTFDRYKPVAPAVNATYAEGIPFRPADLNIEQRAAFSLEPAGAQQDLEVNQRVAYLRGDDANERPVGNFRERPGVEGRLGDIVHSAPTFIGVPSRIGRDTEPFPQTDLYSEFRSSNELRDQVVYVAANDGMVHGFDAETGDEVIAYLPNNLMTNIYSEDITELLSFDYTHRYFVDSTPAVNDVYMDADGDGDKEWTTILINGQGKGGKAYVALNITDPDNFTDLTSEQVVMWEFTDEDDTYPTDEFGDALLADTDLDGDVDDQRQDLLSPPLPVKDLGYTFSVPTIVMSNIVEPDGENKWVSITGNGYNSTAGIAKLLILFLEGGLDGTWCHPDINHNITPDGPYPDDCLDGDEQDFVKLDTGFGVEAGLPNGLGEPRAIDTDGNGTADYVYAGDMQGNFFRFDITNSDFNLWTVTKIFQAQYKPGTVDEMNQPITTQPIAIIHPTEEEGFIIIFGTGSYIRTGDSTDAELQSVYGIWDRLGPELILKSELQQQAYTNFNDPLGRVRTLSDNDVDYSVSGGQKGWYIDLDSPPPGEAVGSPAEFPGEKAVRNIQLRGGLAFVNSIFPRELASCVGRAGGATLSFCPDTGGSLCFGNRTVFDLNNDGAFDADDDINTDETAAGIILEDPSPPTDSTFIGDKRVTQYGRELHIIGTNTSAGNNTGRLSWKRLEAID